MTHLRSQPSIGITARDLVVDYHGARGTVRALDCPALDIGAGASVAVMGPSGCGKSTLLGLLAGLALPTQGVVQIGDQRISTLDEHARVAFRRRVLGVVYQADNLLPHLTVEENVALQMVICRSGQQSSGLPATALPTRGARPTPDAVLARLGLAALASRMPDQLSGGQRQRVAVARAIVHGPSVLLADEPTGALDEASADTVIRLLVEVHLQMGSTLVVVTHDPAIAAHLDRTIHLSDAH